jgi:hypothetical protein
VRAATLRDTRHQSVFRPCLGNKLTAWFVVGNLAKAERIVAVESPIDALSYYSLFAGRCDALAAVSCAGSVVPYELMFQAYDRRQSFVVAFDNDAAGERGWSKAWDDTVDWAGFRLSSECPKKSGTVPWQKPWFPVRNIVSRKPYRGINALLLGSTDYQLHLIAASLPLPLDVLVHRRPFCLAFLSPVGHPPGVGFNW